MILFIGDDVDHPIVGIIFKSLDCRANVLCNVNARAIRTQHDLFTTQSNARQIKCRGIIGAFVENSVLEPFFDDIFAQSISITFKIQLIERNA